MAVEDAKGDLGDGGVGLVDAGARETAHERRQRGGKRACVAFKGAVRRRRAGLRRRAAAGSAQRGDARGGGGARRQRRQERRIMWQPLCGQCRW